MRFIVNGSWLFDGHSFRGAAYADGMLSCFQCHINRYDTELAFVQRNKLTGDNSISIIDIDDRGCISSVILHDKHNRECFSRLLNLDLCYGNLITACIRLAYNFLGQNQCVNVKISDSAIGHSKIRGIQAVSQIIGH